MNTIEQFSTSPNYFGHVSKSKIQLCKVSFGPKQFGLAQNCFRPRERQNNRKQNYMKWSKYISKSCFGSLAWGRPNPEMQPNKKTQPTKKIRSGLAALLFDPMSSLEIKTKNFILTSIFMNTVKMHYMILFMRPST